MTTIELKIRLSAVLRVLDGFTGRPVVRNDVRWTLDGEPVRPEYRSGGYFVFVDLAPGTHEAVLDGMKFKPETLTITVPGAGTTTGSYRLSRPRATRSAGA